MSRSILALNCGSSSLKFGLYSAVGSAVRRLMEGEAEELGKPGSTFWFSLGDDGDKQKSDVPLSGHSEALGKALSVLEEKGFSKPYAVGHRIVHGGSAIRDHQPLSPDLLPKLKDAAAFAPLHSPAALESIASVSEHLPAAKQVLCLDTAFHKTLPDVARCFALPNHLLDEGVVRYGFHGLSLESIMAQLQPVPERLIVAHLGGGCSITAIRQGQSVDTTMGMTPAGGMMMGTRSGDLDPGILLYLLRNGYSNVERLENLLEHESGLVGVSGSTSDFRELQKARSSNQLADLACRMFSYQLSKSILSMAAATGGIDLLVFTGGIGEHNAALRDQVKENLSFLGSFDITALPSEEDLQIARITSRFTSDDN